MYQGIITKYLGPSNVRGARIKATAAAGSITLGWNHALDSDDNHQAAADALMAKFEWDKLSKVVGGGSPDGGRLSVGPGQAMKTAAFCLGMILGATGANAMDITIKTVPYKQMRYETVGDWQFDKAGDLHITVAALGNPQYEFLVAYHELTEAMLCRADGITGEEVDAFDLQYESERAQGKHGATDEPGDDMRAPYHDQHVKATDAEAIMAIRLGVDWQSYGDAINLLGDAK